MKITTYNIIIFTTLNIFLSSAIFMYVIFLEYGQLNLASDDNTLLISNSSSYGIGFTSLVIFSIPMFFAKLAYIKTLKLNIQILKFLHFLLVGLLCFIWINHISHIINLNISNNYKIFLFAGMTAFITTLALDYIFNYIQNSRIVFIQKKISIQSKTSVIICFILSPSYLGSPIYGILSFFQKNNTYESITFLIYLPWLSVMAGVFGIVLFIFPSAIVGIVYLMMSHINNSMRNVICSLVGGGGCFVLLILLGLNDFKSIWLFCLTGSLTAFLVSILLNFLQNFEILLPKIILFASCLLILAIVPLVLVLGMQINYFV